MAQDSEERRELEMQFELRQQERAMFAKAANERIDLATARAQIVVYEIIEQAIAKVAKARGALLVFRMQEFEVPTTTPDKLTPRGVQNRIIPLERRNVWYAAPEADLTGDVIKELLVWPDDTPAAPQKAPAPPSSPRTGGGE
jgi:Skp family chaperone for outer membrane proteins